MSDPRTYASNVDMKLKDAGEKPVENEANIHCDLGRFTYAGAYIGPTCLPF